VNSGLPKGLCLIVLVPSGCKFVFANRKAGSCLALFVESCVAWEEDGTESATGACNSSLVGVSICDVSICDVSISDVSMSLSVTSLSVTTSLDYSQSVHFL
jgi:hypothetical protein